MLKDRLGISGGQSEQSSEMRDLYALGLLGYDADVRAVFVALSFSAYCFASASLQAGRAHERSIVDSGCQRLTRSWMQSYYVNTNGVQ